MTIIKPILVLGRLLGISIPNAPEILKISDVFFILAEFLQFLEHFGTYSSQLWLEIFETTQAKFIMDLNRFTKLRMHLKTTIKPEKMLLG